MHDSMFGMATRVSFVYASTHQSGLACFAHCQDQDFGFRCPFPATPPSISCSPTTTTTHLSDLHTLPSPQHNRARFLPVPVFSVATAALVAYMTWVLTSDARAKGLKNPLGSYADVFIGQQTPQPPQRDRNY